MKQWTALKQEAQFWSFDTDRFCLFGTELSSLSLTSRYGDETGLYQWIMNWCGHFQSEEVKSRCVFSCCLSKLPLASSMMSEYDEATYWRGGGCLRENLGSISHHLEESHPPWSHLYWTLREWEIKVYLVKSLRCKCCLLQQLVPIFLIKIIVTGTVCGGDDKEWNRGWWIGEKYTNGRIITEKKWQRVKGNFKVQTQTQGNCHQK